MAAVTDVAVCEQCGQRHIRMRQGREWGPSCIRHLTTDPQRPCRSPKIKGLEICRYHGAAPAHARAAGAQNVAVFAAEKQLRKLAPDNPDPVRDPIAVLARLAGEADAVRGTVVTMLNDLREEDLFTQDKVGAFQLHALVTLYERWWTNTAKACEALVKSNYLERHAAIEEAHVLALLTVVERGLQLIPDTTLRREVSTAIGAGLKALPHAS